MLAQALCQNVRYSILICQRQRLYPFVLSDLNKAINPYKSYTLYVRAPNLTDTSSGNKFAFVSLNLSLKFRHPLVARDKWDGTTANKTQNIPMKHSGAYSGEVITIQLPSSGTLILADGATGFNTNYETIEQVVLDKFQGGYSVNSERAVSEHIGNDATYEVIAVPMFSGLGNSIDRTNNNSDRLAYAGTTPFTGVIMDRRCIPLTNPMTIHHVIAARNWGATPASNNYKVTSSTFATSIGVGIGTGLQGDNFGYQNIANAQFTQITTSSYIIDMIKEKPGGHLTNDPDHRNWDSELLMVPLVYPAGVSADNLGVSHNLTSAQGTTPGSYNGPPIFVGKSWDGTDNRSNIATTTSGVLATSRVKGQEQWLEVRWSIRDTVHGLTGAVAPSPTWYPTNTIFVGYGGYFVYIIGKKHLL